MHRIRGQDAFHLYVESRTEHHHTIKIQIVDPSTAHEPLDFHSVKESLAKGLAPIPPLHWQLVRVPLKLAAPLWRYQRNLDLDYHVRRAAVPAPGGPRELEEVVSEIASTGLERDRPLWQFWMVEGLAEGHLAFVAKIHHALADGGSSARMLQRFFSESETGEPPLAEHPWPGDEPIPPASQILREGLRDTAGLALRAPAFLLRVGRSARKSFQRRDAPASAKLYRAPATRFNQPLTPQRWFTNVDLPLEDLKRVKTLLGGTLNDVFVTLCGGAIRRYLNEKHELPGAPLVASVPVSIREPEEEEEYGNRLSYWLVSMATDLSDPLERYAAVRRSTRAARENLEATDTGLTAASMDNWWFYRVFFLGAKTLTERLVGRPTFHAIVSNVRGPAKPLYMSGARVVALRSMGPLSAPGGLNFTGWSYLDTLSVGIVACREHVPDVAELGEALRVEVAELLAAAETKVESDPS